MASDLKIEIFAYKCFHDAWLHKGVKDTELNILQIYGNECMKDDSYLEACDNMFENAIGCRVILFSKVYLKEMNLRNAIKWKSLSECYDHVTRICDRDDLFGPLSVFERMLATCAFDLNVCLSIFRPSFIDVANYGHFIWAMYFNKFTDKFYREGGWRELKRVACTYDLLIEVFAFLIKNTPRELFICISKGASVNYGRFKNAVKYDDCKYKHKGKVIFPNYGLNFTLSTSTNMSECH
ncbi:hypothetical protein AVEN_82265-2 [Araneus ventricosus]|uniref:Uncharacterized protein n=1 Tax=Araneus ventricosus TaxID=182803 RepID=A0A4Y2HDN2_ARAVE|nr:hypothetical protein AVEN_82265-2 [Araneus ventricosus]